MAEVDFDRTADDFARYRAGFPDAFFDRLQDHVDVGGRLVLDVGTGTGTLARGFALRGARATGLDPGGALLRQAQRLDGAAGARVNYVQGVAEALPLRDAALDVLSAGQCWHWFDGPRVAAEARRTLRPGGAIVIAYFDWLPLPGNVVLATETLIERFNPEWKLGGRLGIHPRWTRDLAIAGFESIETYSFDQPAPYSHEAWRGRVRASAGVGGSLPADEVRRFDQALAALLRERFPDDPLAAPHRVFTVVARAPGEGESAARDGGLGASLHEGLDQAP